MKSLSLIHAIVLLHEGERLSRRAGETRFVRNSETISRAKELACRVLGRNLRELPRDTQILFLLLEQLAGRVCKVSKIELISCRFTIEQIRADIGWSKKIILVHLDVLKDAGYVALVEKQYQILLSSREVGQFDPW